MTGDLLSTTGDHFSPDRRYRYALWKWWAQDSAGWHDAFSKGRLCMVLLNPSTGSKEKFDATNIRCERRARKLGFGGIIFVNLFPLVATNPQTMLAADDPIGYEAAADEAIRGAASCAGMIICGWGAHGTHRGRAANVSAMLHDLNLHVLGLTQGGEPKHPLYVGYNVPPQRWKP